MSCLSCAGASSVISEAAEAPLPEIPGARLPRHQGGEGAIRTIGGSLFSSSSKRDLLTLRLSGFQNSSGALLFLHSPKKEKIHFSEKIQRKSPVSIPVVVRKPAVPKAEPTVFVSETITTQLLRRRIRSSPLHGAVHNPRIQRLDLLAEWRIL